MSSFDYQLYHRLAPPKKREKKITSNAYSIELMIKTSTKKARKNVKTLQLLKMALWAISSYLFII